jgi:Family of unknown function (DUF6328)
MKLASALKLSLDELRMQMLGVQVLFGFQFQGLFQNNFESLPLTARAVDAAGLMLMIIVLGLILAVASQHRIVEAGADTQRIFRMSLRFAKYALAPLAGAIACDLYVATVEPFGAKIGMLLGSAAFLLATGAWYVFGLVMRKQSSPRTSARFEPKTSVHTKIEQMLTESRMILPGAQALLGFQLIVMLTKAFEQLPMGMQGVHFIALSSTVLAIILLIMPAAIHRLAFDGADDLELHVLGSRIITIALLPLASAIACDMGVALFQLFGNITTSAIGAFVSGTLLILLWYVFPLIVRRRLRQGPRSAAPL